MKKIILGAVMMFAVVDRLCAEDKTIAEFYGITNIAKINITFSPTGDFSPTNCTCYKILDEAFLEKTLDLIKALPSTGEISKKWPKVMPLWHVEMFPDAGKPVMLTIWDTRLEAPAGESGKFYLDTGGKEMEFVKHMQSHRSVKIIDAAPLEIVVRSYEELSGNHVEIAKGVNANLRIQSDKPLKKQEYVKMIESKLKEVNIGLFPSSNNSLVANWIDPALAPTNKNSKVMSVSTNNVESYMDKLKRRQEENQKKAKLEDKSSETTNTPSITKP